MPTYDLARVLREYVLETLRQELSARESSVLLIGDTEAAAGFRWRADTFDAAWIQLERPAAIEVRGLAGSVVQALRPGGRLVCVLHTGMSGGQPRRFAFSTWRRAFEPETVWKRSRALGTLVRSRARSSGWHPLVLGLLAAAEEVVGSWPLVRAHGEWVIHEGVRR